MVNRCVAAYCNVSCASEIIEIAERGKCAAYGASMDAKTVRSFEHIGIALARTL